MHAHIVPGSRVYCRVSHRQHITVGCQLRTLSRLSSIPTIGFNTKRVQKGHVTLKWSVTCHCARSSGRSNVVQLGSRWTTTLPTNVGAILPGRQCDRVSALCSVSAMITTDNTRNKQIYRGCCGPDSDTGCDRRAARADEQAHTGRHPPPGPGKQIRPAE